MKFTNWKVSVLHPVNKNVLEEKIFRNIEDISFNYPLIPLSTWRNISIGRSKIYDNFIKLEKLTLENKIKSNKKLESIDEKEISTFTEVESDYDKDSDNQTTDSN